MSTTTGYSNSSSIIEDAANGGGGAEKGATGLKRRRDGGGRAAGGSRPLLLDIGYGISVNAACVLWVRLRSTEPQAMVATRWSLEIALVGAAAPLVVECGEQVPHEALRLLRGESRGRRRPRQGDRPARTQPAVYSGNSASSGTVTRFLGFGADGLPRTVSGFVPIYEPTPPAPTYVPSSPYYRAD